MKVRTTPLERLAVGAAVSLFIAGTILGYLYDSVWLNRFGSLIIVVGVVITAIKVSDILNQQIEQFMTEGHQRQMEKLIDVNQSFFGGSPPPGYIESLERAVKEKVLETFAVYKQKRIDRVKRVEISVLVFGTITNGFGDFLLNLFKAAAVCSCAN